MDLGSLAKELLVPVDRRRRQAAICRTLIERLVVGDKSHARLAKQHRVAKRDRVVREQPDRVIELHLDALAALPYDDFVDKKPSRIAGGRMPAGQLAGGLGRDSSR